MASTFQIRHAASIIKRGGIIAYPTDTIYGLGCDPLNNAADSPDILSNIQWQSAEPTTWILPASDKCPLWLRHEDNTVAIRITAHKLVTALCKQLQSALISTSANISGMAPVNDKLGIHRLFRGRVNAILFSDENSTGKPSAVITFSDQSIIRH